MVIDFIQNNYSDSISIDDMIQNIHISKYHFIRLFRRIMGTTPYNYLTNYRINKSKLLLRTTNKSIAEISEECGFLDTSNFISQFKRIPIKNQPIIDAILLSFLYSPSSIESVTVLCKTFENETRSTLDVGIYPIECTANNVDYVFDIVNNVINILL